MTGDAFSPRLAVLRDRSRIRVSALTGAIAIALVGCSRHGEPLWGEAALIDYQMADLLAPDNTPSGALARRGLADGYLSASEASSMWRAYHAETQARVEADKLAIINRWKRSATAKARGEQ